MGVYREAQTMVRTRIDSMQIVEIWCEAKSLDGPFDVRLDVRRRIGDAAVPKDVEPALRSDYTDGYLCERCNAMR